MHTFKKLGNKIIITKHFNIFGVNIRRIKLFVIKPSGKIKKLNSPNRRQGRRK